MVNIGNYEHINPSPKRLSRDTHNKMLGGVSVGIANYFNIDPLIIRLLFVALTFFNGIGIPIYIVLWILMPKTLASSSTTNRPL